MLDADEPSPILHHPPATQPGAWAAGVSPFLLAADHAGNRLPRALGDLGISAADLARHIGWDIGAARVTARLAAQLGAPAVLSGYSRLLIDYNRTHDDPTLICQVSDGTVVPANRGVDAAERQKRIDVFHTPYHDAIAAEVARLSQHVAAPALISIHSFTPAMQRGPARPWHVGILWNRDPRIPVPLMRVLAEEPDIVVGDNEPYTGRDNVGYTMRRHAGAAGYPHVLIEVRQDLIGEEAGAIAWGDRLAGALRRILAEHGPFKPEHLEGDDHG